ncbi:MAG TPA: 3-isopropylmalate dehydratase large subunit [Alphaproteobacteria bacterium]|nr:3-isopropylmalate dehydratase large subunit [Alphaproteobacteria bacterium]
MSAPRTLFEKIWSLHEIRDFGNGFSLIHVDRNILHDLLGALVFEGLDTSGRRLRNPELNFATMDHGIETFAGRSDETSIPGGEAGVKGMREKTNQYGVTLFDLGDVRQGIVHVVSPESGIALPGCTLICGDSHTCTVGGVGALTWGVGLSQIEHVLATQTVVLQKPKTLRITFNGAVPGGVTPKDMILYTIGHAGANAGNTYCIEYAGEAIRAMPVEGRLTVCNMSIEMAARYGVVAGDETTFEYLDGTDYAPTGALWDQAVQHWRTLPTDEGAAFDREIAIDCAAITPQVTWGTSPEHVMGVNERVPDPADAPAGKGVAWERALGYTGLTPGEPIEGAPVDVAFIGSCTNSRLSDLRRAAKILDGRKVSTRLARAWVVPGSGRVKRDAEAEGLDEIFKTAGFEWREPGCSLCTSLGGDRFEPGHRVMSTTNRNFENRQGAGARTHLASPEMVAAAAVAGKITDVRKLAG